MTPGSGSSHTMLRFYHFEKTAFPAQDKILLPWKQAPQTAQLVCLVWSQMNAHQVPPGKQDETLYQMLAQKHTSIGTTE